MTATDQTQRATCKHCMKPIKQRFDRIWTHDVEDRMRFSTTRAYSKETRS